MGVALVAITVTLAVIINTSELRTFAILLFSSEIYNMDASLRQVHYRMFLTEGQLAAFVDSGRVSGWHKLIRVY